MSKRFYMMGDRWTGYLVIDSSQGTDVLYSTAVRKTAVRLTKVLNMTVDTLTNEQAHDIVSYFVPWLPIDATIRWWPL